MSHNSILTVENSNTPSDVPIEFVTNSGTAIAVANVLYILGVGGVVTSAPGSSNTINVTVSGSGFTWNAVTSASPTNPIQIVPENGYACQGVSLVTFILPLAPNFGDTFIIASTTSRFQITANGSQQMRVGNAITSAGSGTLTSNTVGDFVEFVYLGSNIFQCFGPQGSLTLT